MRKYSFITPIGWIALSEEDGFLVELDFCDGPLNNNEESELLKYAKRQIIEYFNGVRTEFGIPIKYNKGTPFQQSVWEALKKIPYGKTWSYQDIAELIKMPKACRAVGGANNANPLPIIIPCHRVIGKNGKMVGYGGGIDKKVFLLELEKRKKADE